MADKRPVVSVKFAANTATISTLARLESAATTSGDVQGAKLIAGIMSAFKKQQPAATLHGMAENLANATADLLFKDTGGDPK